MIVFLMVFVFGVVLGVGFVVGLYGFVLVGLFVVLFGGIFILIFEFIGLMMVVMIAVIVNLIVINLENGMIMVFIVVMLVGLF